MAENEAQNGRHMTVVRAEVLGELDRRVQVSARLVQQVFVAAGHGAGHVFGHPGSEEDGEGRHGAASPQRAGIDAAVVQDQERLVIDRDAPPVEEIFLLSSPRRLDR